MGNTIPSVQFCQYSYMLKNNILNKIIKLHLDLWCNSQEDKRVKREITLSYEIYFSFLSELKNTCFVTSFKKKVILDWDILKN